MATHSSVLAWRIPGMVKPGGLPSMGSHRVRHDWSDLAAAAYAYIREEKMSQINNLSFHLKNLGKKEQVKLKESRKEEITKSINQWNLKLNNETKSLYFEETNIIDKPLARLTEREERHKWHKYKECNTGYHYILCRHWTYNKGLQTWIWQLMWNGLIHQSTLWQA